MMKPDISQQLSKFCNSIQWAVILSLVLYSSPILAQVSFSNCLENDSLDVYDEKVFVSHPISGTETSDDKILLKSFKKKYKVRKNYCVGGHSYKDFDYVFLHTEIDFPQNSGNLDLWDIIFKKTNRPKNSQLLESGWYTERQRKYFYVVNKSVATDASKTVIRLTI